MVGHGGSSAGSYLADPTSPIPSHCASIVATSTLRVNQINLTSIDAQSCGKIGQTTTSYAINYFLFISYSSHWWWFEQFWRFVMMLSTLPNATKVSWEIFISYVFSVKLQWLKWLKIVKQDREHVLFVTMSCKVAPAKFNLISQLRMPFTE